MGCLQVLVFEGGELSLLAEVDADASAEDGFAVEFLTDLDGRFGCVKGANYATEGLEGREGVERVLGI